MAVTLLFSAYIHPTPAGSAEPADKGSHKKVSRESSSPVRVIVNKEEYSSVIETDKSVRLTLNLKWPEYEIEQSGKLLMVP